MLLNRFYSMAVCFDDMLLVYIVILSPSLLVSSLTEMLACEFYCQWTSRSINCIGYVLFLFLFFLISNKFY